MDYGIAGLMVVLLLWAAWAATTERRYRKREELGQLPPGPTRWPVVGNIFQLAGGVMAPHQLLAKLANKYGAVMTLQLGSMTTVVVSSSQAAQAMFKGHDTVLAGRTIYEAMKGDINSDGSIITAQFGPRWRTLRRLCTMEFFASAPLEVMRPIRARCVDEMVEYIRNVAVRSNNGEAVDVGKVFFVMAFNLISNLIFSKNLLEAKSEKGAKFFYHTGKTMEWAGKPNVADFWPWLRWFDPQGIRRRTQFHVKHAFDIAGEFLEERMKDNESGPSSMDKMRKDYLDVLLGYEGDGIEGVDPFAPTAINVIVFEMFTAGTDTTTSTLEWAMAELLHNPDTLQKVQLELQSTIRPGEKLIEEDLNNLSYLKAVVKETLRLHPPLPFLVPHRAMEPCKFQGFHIPKDTQILVNAWAIGRDPETWKNPLEFNPDRFLHKPDVDYKGHHFEFIPFGSGRRICPAVSLAGRVLPLALGSVLHLFDWRLVDGLKGGEMDMRERMGITLRKAVPLKAVPVPFC